MRMIYEQASNYQIQHQLGILTTFEDLKLQRTMMLRQMLNCCCPDS